MRGNSKESRGIPKLCFWTFLNLAIGTSSQLHVYAQLLAGHTRWSLVIVLVPFSFSLFEGGVFICSCQTWIYWKSQNSCQCKWRKKHLRTKTEKCIYSKLVSCIWCKSLSICTLCSEPSFHPVYSHFLVSFSAWKVLHAWQFQLCFLMCLASLAHEALITHVWIFLTNTWSYSPPWL